MYSFDTMKSYGTQQTNELQLEYNSADYLHAFITLDGLEKVLKLTKNGKTLGQCNINPLNPELNPICYLLALLGAHHFLHVSRIRVK